jgi:signal transduction histidine kinase
MQRRVGAEPLLLLLDEGSARRGAVAEPKGLRLAIELDDKVAETLVRDRTKLHRVRIDRLHHAVEFADKASIILSPRMVEKVLVLTVSDTSRGIEAAMHQALFERFHQPETRAVGLYGGTGLGLVSSRDLVSLMGGRMEVDSEPSRGSEFRVILPARP